MKKPVILVVEDEAIIRMNAVQMLEEAGYYVLEAWNADAAIKILGLRSDIRAVFTDIQMPGSWDGLRLAHAIKRRWPPIHLILTSGRMALNKEDFPVGGRFIRKPYEAERVVATLRELLGSNPPSHPIEGLDEVA